MEQIVRRTVYILNESLQFMHLRVNGFDAGQEVWKSLLHRGQRTVAKRIPVIANAANQAKPTISAINGK